MTNISAAIIGIVERALIKPQRFLYRSSDTGKFVTKAFADANPETPYARPIRPRVKANPDTTVRQRVGA